MSFFPFFQDLAGRTFLVVGSGAIARRKTKLIMQFTDHVKMITMDNEDQSRRTELCAFEQAGAIVLRRSFREEDLKEADFCIASTDDSSMNRFIADLCFEKKIPVNVPDDPGKCSFYLPAVIKRGDLVIAVSTGGHSPAMAGYLRKKFEKDLPDNTEQILDRMEELRKWLPDFVDDSSIRGQIYKEILADLIEEKISPTDENVRKMALQLARLQL